MPGGIFCSKELPLFCDISGVRKFMPGGGGFFVQRNCLCFLTNLGYVCRGGGFFVQRNYLWFLRFFGTNSRWFFERNCFVFEKFMVLGYGGGKCLDHKKKRLLFFSGVRDVSQKRTQQVSPLTELGFAKAYIAKHFFLFVSHFYVRFDTILGFFFS